LFLFKKQHLLKEVQSFQAKKLTIKSQENSFFTTQIDGELYYIDTNTISVSLLEKRLNVII
jgi:diacylglycerol kinase family enzyme